MKRSVARTLFRPRAGSLRTLALFLLGIAVLFPSPARAFEAIDGRFEAHGYFEMQVRTISRNYSGQWDLTQWYNVFNLELELDLVQDTHGILDLLEVYVRIEARYDCIYSHGCGMFQGVDVYGNDSENLPARLNSGDEYSNAGSIFISNDGPLTDPNRDPYTIKTVPGFRGIYEGTPQGLGNVDYRQLMRCAGSSIGAGGDAYCPEEAQTYLAGRIPARFWNADRNRRAEGTGGMPGAEPAVDDGTEGAPYLIAMEPFLDFKFASVPVIGGSSNGHPLLLMGPWLPENFVSLNATLADLPNPLDQSRISPQSLAAGFGANAFRPIPVFREDDPGQREIYILQEDPLTPDGPVTGGRFETINPLTGRFGDQREAGLGNRAAESYEARGLFVPSPPLREALAAGGFGNYPFNISEIDRAFNRGASQQDEGELKEAYFDIEMFDSRLWLRLGKQNIVWGKTELFRTTDQFNPQDLALSTLPNLEESRIGLWAGRGVWSFYEVGPLSDVRLEVAMNFDEFESADLGACGEPYAVNLICALTFGSWAHGITGLGVAGIDQPPAPWNDSAGIEFGVRLEWRWDRFSFAITDFYGYDDFPYTVRLSTYGRNVDWRSGRPRIYMQTPEQLADVASYGCATPEGRGVVWGSAGDPPDFTEAPTGPGTYVGYGGSENAGCLTPGATNRNISYLAQLDGAGQEIEYGVPHRVSPEVRNESFLENSLTNMAGGWLNDSARSDADDPRWSYSKATVANPSSAADWREGPQAHLCESDPRLAGHPDCAERATDTMAPKGARGRRVFDTEKFVTWNGDVVPNPRYNPFYNPRFDRHFDVGHYDTTAPTLENPVPQFGFQANPGDFIAATPVRFDPFRALSDPVRYSDKYGHMWWGNAYDPTLEEFDPRNSLVNNPINVSLFNFICAVTVGFSALDPSACALTVFSSSKQPSGADAGNPRISTLIGSFMSGNGGFNSFLGKAPSDEILSKGPLLPRGMGMPLVKLHDDMGAADVDGAGLICASLYGCGRDAFRTTDVRRHWIDLAVGLPGTETSAYPWIYAREGESFNCLGGDPSVNAFGGLHLCGGLGIGDISVPESAKRRAFNVGYFLDRAVTPEQEALLGCGPYFRQSCDANGADLMWAEGSVLTAAFTGSDSLGISLLDLGIAGLVSSDFGTHLTDNGSGPLEYRTDGRVIGSNGRLLRIDELVPGDSSSRTPGLGSNGYLLVSNAAPMSDFFPAGIPSSGCKLGAGNLLNADGSYNFTDDPASPGFADSQDRASARCWDLREYYRAYAIQPGTAAFDILGLGGPRCTTADIGGPLDPVAGVLPGCRNKWATIQYQPLDSWDPATGLHPNNPDAGYLGNNWYGQVLSYKSDEFDPSDLSARNPRTDYRQWSADPRRHDPSTDNLATYAGSAFPVVPCGTGDPNLPENYDCYLRNPTDWGLPDYLGTAASVRMRADWVAGAPQFADQRAAAVASVRSGLNWGVFAAGGEFSACDPSLYDNEAQMRNDPDCYLGGWRQTVDGDPDRLGIDNLLGVKYPKYVQAMGVELPIYNQVFTEQQINSAFNFGQRVEGGCTPGSSWIYIQRTSDGELLPPAECAQVYQSPLVDPLDFLSVALKGGSGHPFTGESFASELAGVSFNLLMLLVTFSPEFTDGLASVRGYVNPEIYESRYIYDEEWMWNPDCDGLIKTAAECGGRLFVEDTNPFSGGQAPYSAYGDPNRDVETLAPGRVRQVSGWRSLGVTNMPNVAERASHIPNPLPGGVENKLQRDPSLANILTDFPDLLMRECTSARLNTDPGLTTRQLYENCGTVANGGVSDWTINPTTGKPWQELRLGNFAEGPPTGGLLESLQWDYVFTGGENEFMARIPYCEDLGYTQRHIFEAQGDNLGGGIDRGKYGFNRIDCSRGLEGETLGTERCTMITPQYCSTVQALSGIAGQKRNVLRAGGNANFGRRTMQWQSGSEIYLSYNRRNVLGFSMDFAEDYTKSNWSMEFTWIEGIPFTDSNSYDLVTEADDFNLTVSVDRPTFINFLNANRTFFINSQWFFQYRKGYRDSFSSIGPWNVLATFAIFTGYFQDRLNPTMVFVYDFRSGSGGFLPQVNYRFSENFSMTVGASVFMGEQRYVDMGVNTIGPASPRSGPHAYQDGSDPGLSIVRDRDEVFMTLRYTF